MKLDWMRFRETFCRPIISHFEKSPAAIFPNTACSHKLTLRLIFVPLPRNDNGLIFDSKYFTSFRIESRDLPIPISCFITKLYIQFPNLTKACIILLVQAWNISRPNKLSLPETIRKPVFIGKKHTNRKEQANK